VILARETPLVGADDDEEPPEEVGQLRIKFEFSMRTATSRNGLVEEC